MTRADRPASRPSVMKWGEARIWRPLLSLMLCVTLLSTAPASAYANVLADDYIGSRTLTDRELTVIDAPDVDAECGILVSSDGEVLWARNADEKHSIASITKVMTAVVALENASLDTQITVTPEAASVGESSASLVAGSTLSLKTLLHGMLIESGNDAAVAIADGVAGTQIAFVQLMNEKAAELGMTSTVYVDPNGLDDTTKSTARDLSILIRYAMKNPTFRSIVGTASEQIDLGSGTVTITNTNELLTDFQGCIGVKTGTTDIAGNCLTAAASRNGLELYSVVLGSSGYYTRFTSSEALLEWGYAHYVPITLGDTTTVVANVPHSQWMDVSVPVACASSKTAYVLDFDGAIHQSISVTELKGDVKAGDVCGSITWTQGNKVVASCNLVATEDVQAPGVLDRIRIWFKRTFTSEPDTLELETFVEPPEVPSPSADDEAA